MCFYLRDNLIVNPSTATDVSTDPVNDYPLANISTASPLSTMASPSPTLSYLANSQYQPQPQNQHLSQHYQHQQYQMHESLALSSSPAIDGTSGVESVRHRQVILEDEDEY